MALTAVVASIAIPHEPCLDPRELSIQEQTCLLTNPQAYHSASNEQSIRPTGDIGNLALTHEWIADDSLDLPDAVETAESYSVKTLDRAEEAQKDPLEEAAHWHASDHGSPSGTEFNSPFRLSSPSPRPRRAHVLSRDDQYSMSDNLTPANDEQRRPETRGIWMNGNGATEYSEAGDASRQILSDQVQHEYLSLNEDQNPERTENRSFEATRGRRCLSAANNTRLAQGRQVKSKRKLDLDLSRIGPKRNSIMKSNRAIVPMTGSRKKKLRNKPLFERETARLESYISQHRRKCEKMGLPCPGDFVYSAETKIRLASLGLESHVNVLRVLSLTIGSCESLVVLKEILRAYRDPSSGSLETTRDVSNAKRLETIRSLSGNAAFFNLLKKCHIHRLFTDNKDSLCDPTDNFIISTAMSVTTRPQGETGNPRNSAEAKITKSIMREVYPEVHSNSADYRLKYREVTELRRTGRRLDMLVSRFGLGILGLLPLAQQDSFPGLASKIADGMQVPHLLHCRACVTCILGYRIFRITSSKAFWTCGRERKATSLEKLATLPPRWWRECFTEPLIPLPHSLLKTLIRSKLQNTRKDHLSFLDFSNWLRLLHEF